MKLVEINDGEGMKVSPTISVVFLAHSGLTSVVEPKQFVCTQKVKTLELLVLELKVSDVIRHILCVTSSVGISLHYFFNITCHYFCSLLQKYFSPD
jgi:hypothetical protein